MKALAGVRTFQSVIDPAETGWKTRPPFLNVEAWETDATLKKILEKIKV